jgi:hypothetical protein
VIIGDTLDDPPPSPLKCHVLFEWPLIPENSSGRLEICQVRLGNSLD